MQYSNADSNFSAQNFQGHQGQPLNPFNSQFTHPLQSATGGGWQQPDVQQALQQFIAQQVAAQMALRQQPLVQQPFVQQPLLQPLQAAPHLHAGSIGPAQLQLLIHAMHSLQGLAQQLVQLAALHAQQLAGINTSFGHSQSFASQGSPGSYAPIGMGQPGGAGLAVH
jgi:hypothetical protein